MSDSVVRLYERHATAWDADRDKSLFERAWLDRFTAPLAPGATVLDIGCGGGEPIGRHLIESGFALTAIDSAPSLISLAETRFPQAEWRVMDMRALALGRRFDALLAWHSFFHLAPIDQRPMFARFAAHANPRAMLMFTSGSKAGEAIGNYRGEPLHHASLAPEEYRRLLDESGFEVLAYEADDPRCGGATVWLARKT